MALPKRMLRRMYAVSADGIGIISGTMTYSRKGAICHFLDRAHTTRKYDPKEWEQFKRSGYRTVKCGVMIEDAVP